MKIQEYNALTKENIVRDATAEEIADLESIAVNKSKVKLAEIRLQRNLKLKDTDYLGLSDNTMSEEMKTYRQNLRNIPQDYSEDKYDELLATDEQGNLTHTVWEKP
tara:strand:+ start:603 stop:920 length:318 start_codon:yes stop_codon:yes gene_type:complete